MNKKLPLVYLSRRECFSAAHTLNRCLTFSDCEMMLFYFYFYNYIIYSSKHLTPEQNKEIFTKCNNCHGHNYVGRKKTSRFRINNLSFFLFIIIFVMMYSFIKVEVTVKGGVDATTGMVINACTLRNYMMVILKLNKSYLP